MPAAPALDAAVSLCRRRGLVMPSADVHSSAQQVWDYGPLGAELRSNLRRQWWRATVQRRDDVVGLDSAIILPAPTWSASGHEERFTTRRIMCEACGRAQHPDHLDRSRRGHRLADTICPACGTIGAWSEVSEVSGLVRADVGRAESPQAAPHYLRPEVAQGALVNFAHLLASARRRPPFGVAQIGRAFRDEVTPGDFIYRTREFEQMQLTWFAPPGESGRWLDEWVRQRLDWYTALGLPRESLRVVERCADPVAPHAVRTVDIEYRFGDEAAPSAGWGELESVMDRGDTDLRRHAQASGTDLAYFDQATRSRWVPHVVDAAAGLERAFLAFVAAAYTEDSAPSARGGQERRVVLRLDPRLAPVKVAVLPLSRHERLAPVARRIAAELRELWMCDVDDAAAIGRRYRRQDEIGTPFCVTVDFATLDDAAVTVRERDSMAQERVPLAGLVDWLTPRLRGC